VQVNYYGHRIAGPEQILENAVVSNIAHLFNAASRSLWAAASLPIGAGKPDLIIAEVEPEIIALANIELSATKVMAYLRAIHKARASTIASKMNKPRVQIVKSLDSLLNVGAIKEEGGNFSLASSWRNILPIVTCIEVNIADWRRVLNQAVRNSIFSHYSYVALPESVANRVLEEPGFFRYGIGILSVSKLESVTLLRRSKLRSPKVWSYYYQLASTIARQSNGEKIDLPNYPI